MQGSDNPLDERDRVCVPASTGVDDTEQKQSVVASSVEQPTP